MTQSDRILELLERWDELHSAGQDPTLEEFCPDDPVLRAELARRIERRRKLERRPDTIEFDATPIEVPAEPEIPGYEVLGPLGRGGMGMVYKARQIRLNRVVALKVVLGQFAIEPRQLARFVAEAEAVAAIDHPHVIRIFDTGAVGATPFIAMEYLPNGTLADRIKKHSPMAPRDAADLVRRIALGVHAAHENQIVHRDLKPANILFDADNAPKVADFGLAKKESGADLTHTGIPIGTPAYMSPEQAKGKSKFVGPQADVWALGVMLYECLSGQRPFTGSNEYEICRNVIEREPSGVRSLNHSVPTDLDLVLRKCLSKNPADRYPTAHALAVDLECWLAGKPVSAKKVGRLERTAKWVRRNKLATGILVGALAAAAAFAGLGLWANAKAREARIATKDALEKKEIADTKTKEAEALAKATQRQLSAMCIREADAAMLSSNYGWAREVLDQVPPGNRSSAWHMTRVAVGEPGVSLSGHTSSVTNMAWSPDGRQIATGSDDKTVRLWDAISGKSIHKLEGHENAVRCLSWSPDGKFLASGSMDKTVRLWNAAKGEFLHKLDGHNAEVRCVAWSPDSRMLATASRDNTVRVWDAATGKLARELKEHTKEGASVSWSNDGNAIVTVCSCGAIRTWSVETGALLSEHNLGAKYAVNRASWSPDGQICAMGCSDGIVRIKNVASGSTVFEIRMASHHVAGCLSWSPDGRFLAVCTFSTLVYVWDCESHAVRILLGDERAAYCTAWSPDCRTLATAGITGILRILDAHSDSTRWALLGHTDAVLSVAWSPTGSKLASGSADRTVKIWDAQTGKALAVLPGHSSYITCVAWNPDGETLASSSDDSTVRVWDAASNQLRFVLDKHKERVASLSWNPDGNMLATGSADKSILIWNFASRTVVHTLKHSDRVRSVSWSPDGGKLASGSEDKSVRVWNTSTGELLHTLPHPSRVRSVCWSADGGTIASGSEDNAVRLWNPLTGELLRTLKGHTNFVTSVHWCSDGQSLASASVDFRVKLWDTATGMAVHTHDNDALYGYMFSVAWNPGGRRLASGNGNGLVSVRNSWRELPLPFDLSRSITSNPAFHREQAAICEKSQNWFAAAFHLRRLVELEPNDATVRERLQTAEVNLKPSVHAPLPQK